MCVFIGERDEFSRLGHTCLEAENNNNDLNIRTWTFRYVISYWEYFFQINKCATSARW